MVDYCLKPNISILRPVTILLAILISSAWTFCPSSAVADHDEHGLRIDSAEWKNETHTLEAQGRGPGRTVITIQNDSTNEMIGSTRSDRSGEWTFKADLSNSPCSIRAEANGDHATREVSGTPSACGEAQSPTPTMSSLSINGPSSLNEGTSATFVAVASYQDGTTAKVTATWSENSSYASISANGLLTANMVTSNQTAIITASYTSAGTTRTAVKNVTIVNGTASAAAKSITSTSQNRDTLPSAAVPEQPFINLPDFSIFAVNDLGMHCGDLDHRIASILPPFNVLHAVVVKKGNSNSPPRILTPAEVQVFYSAASNPDDPALQSQPSAPIFKTNFWEPNPANPASTIAFDGFDPFYPPNVLSPTVLNGDNGLPSPDLAALYPISGPGELIAYQQDMPGISDPYVANTPMPIERFDTDLPFFVNFPFGYELTNMNWFAADGIPMTPYDDFGRKNSFPLMRVQAKSSTSGLTGTAHQIVASLDTVIPISAEADCAKCHTSATDGGNGQAACVPGVISVAVFPGPLEAGPPSPWPPHRTMWRMCLRVPAKSGRRIPISSGFTMPSTVRSWRNQRLLRVNNVITPPLLTWRIWAPWDLATPRPTAGIREFTKPTPGSSIHFMPNSRTSLRMICPHPRTRGARIHPPANPRPMPLFRISWIRAVISAIRAGIPNASGGPCTTEGSSVRIVMEGCVRWEMIFQKTSQMPRLFRRALI